MIRTRGTVTPYGYRRIRCSDRRQRFEHVLVWEEHHGPVPKGMEIHHINHDKLDNRIENLRLLTRLEHKRLHSGCFRFGDRWLKRCSRCEWVRPVDTDFYVYPKSGVESMCKRCCVDIAVEGKRRRKEKARQARDEAMR